MHTTIQTLFKKGYNKTQIAEMLNINRKTVGKVLKQLEEKGTVERKEYASILDEYKEFINIQTGKELSAIRIFQDLKRDYGYQGSYDTVKKYVAFASHYGFWAQPNCHISYKGNYYSVPYAYIGQEVEVVVINSLLKIYHHEKEIALHHLRQGEKGNFITNKEHYPRSKNITAEEILSSQKEEMAKIGINDLIFNISI